MATCCIHCGVEEGELHLSNCPELRSAFERIERQRDEALAEARTLRNAAVDLQAEIERLREHHKVAVDWWMQEAQSVKPMAEEIERLRKLLKQALPHVEDAGDDTLAAIIDTQIGSQKW